MTERERARKEIEQLVVKALHALHLELEVPVDELPASVAAILYNFGVDCMQRGIDSVYTEQTGKFSKTIRSFPSPVPPAPPPLEPEELEEIELDLDDLDWSDLNDD